MRRAAGHFWRARQQAKAGAYDVWIWTKCAALALKSFFADLDAIAVLTAVLVIVAYLQWLTLEKTDQTLKLQQRAWIAPGRLIAPQNFIEQKDEAAAIGLTFKNVGKEPAIELNEQIKADIVETSRWRDDTFIEVKVREMLGKRCENFGPHQTDGPSFLVHLPLDMSILKLTKQSRHPKTGLTLR